MRSPVKASTTVYGLPLDRLGQEFLARKAGCSTWPRITKKVDLCVASNPHDLTGKLSKAEDYGIEVVYERDFWPALGWTLA